MGIIGYFGDIIFETSDERILTFAGFTRESSTRWATHNLLGRKPGSEFLGPELDVVRFTVTLNGRFGVRPRDEMVRWLVKCRSGTVETLVIGGSALGMYKWAVINVSQMWDVVMNRGEVLSGRVEVELEEYLRGV